MTYSAKNYSHLLGLSGFSETLLSNHFTLYEGYVKNTNALNELLTSKVAGTPEYSELRRRFGWEWNGMRMHELYFDNMSKEPMPLSNGSLKAKIMAVYGSVEQWESNFVAVGSMRGIGWTVLVHDTGSDELYTIWVNEHDLGHLVGTSPLLVMDVFEHAFMIDYELKRADYIAAFLKVVNWDVVEQRFAH